jgi:Sec-independent protein translocase protein TatA
MAIIGALALMLFGPEQLPKVARKVGHVMRDVQNTSQSFIREMERAADDLDPANPYHSTMDTTYQPPVETPVEHTTEHTEAAGAALPKARQREPEYRID